AWVGLHGASGNSPPRSTAQRVRKGELEPPMDLKNSRIFKGPTAKNRHQPLRSVSGGHSGRRDGERHDRVDSPSGRFPPGVPRPGVEGRSKRLQTGVAPFLTLVPRDGGYRGSTNASAGPLRMFA